MTAVEWLEENLLFEPWAEEHFEYNKECWDKAKEMEKQIIAQAFEDGDYNYFYNSENGKEFENGIEYYNQKFKSE